jgi:uncharacterized protein YraI
MWSNVRNSSLLIVAAVAIAFPPGCAPATAPPDSKELTEDPVASGEGLTGSIPVGTELVATGNVNLRTNASTSSSIIRVIPNGSKVTVQSSAPSNGFYKIKHNGTVGWSYGAYYEPTGGTSGSQPVGTNLVATGDVNLRSGPSTSNSVIDVVTQGSTVSLVDPNPQNGFYNVDFNGNVGWSSAKYYSSSGSSGGGGTGGGSSGGGGTGGGSAGGGSTSPTVAAAMQRAEAGPGFSYWWGHGRFKPEGPAGSPGSCSGGCPSCTHSGSYGGDCSGFVAKVWQVPSSNTNLTVDSHPYSTADFHSDTSQWKTVSKSSVKQADAYVYRSGGSGHIFIYSHGDGWGSMYAYECKGCSAGCLKGYRTATSAYHAIRRAGY